MKNRTPRQEVKTSVVVGFDDDGVEIERDVTLTFDLHAGCRATRTSPAEPPEAELVRATFDDDGSEVPEGTFDEDTLWDLGTEAAQQQDDEDGAAQCRHEDAQMEELRERQLAARARREAR